MNFIEKINLLEQSLSSVVTEMNTLKEKVATYEYLYPKWIPIKQIYKKLNYKSSDGLRKRLLTNHIQDIDFQYNGKYIEIKKELFEELLQLKGISL